MPLSPAFMPRLLTRVPPLLSDLVPCNTARRRCRSGDRLIDNRLRRSEAVPERPSAAAGEAAVGLCCMLR